jgi:hypothetical protein
LSAAQDGIRADPPAVQEDFPVHQAVQPGAFRGMAVGSGQVIQDPQAAAAIPYLLPVVESVVETQSVIPFNAGIPRKFGRA